MQIIVPIKQVPESDEQRYDPATRTIVREGVASVINPFDKRALTEAVRLRALYGGSIIAITMGPPQAREALVECLGRGVDKAIHLTDRLFAGADTLATARTLAAAIRRLPFDLLLLGKYSTDSATGQVGPELAELLDLPQVTGATAIEPVGDRTLCVTRETDTGFEVIECPLPALLTAAERLIKPTKTRPPVIEEGQRRLAENPSLIETWTAYDLGITVEEAGLSGSPTWVFELRPVEIARAREMLSGDIIVVAKNLLHALEQAGLKGSDGSRPISAPVLPDAPSNPDPSKSVWAVAELLPANPEQSKIGAPTEPPKSKIGAPSGPPKSPFRRVSFELMSEAARLAWQLGGEAVGVLMGSGLGEEQIVELAGHGAHSILLADDARLEPYTTEAYAWVLANAIRERRPWAVLLPATAFGRDLAPRVAARLGLGLTGDCVGLELDHEGRLLQLKPAFGGQVLAPIISRTLPAMATVRPGMLPVYAPSGARKASVTRLSLEGLPTSRTRVLSSTYEGEAGLALDAARLVVCVGAGIGGPEALPEIEQLAQKLGAWMGLSPEEVAIGGTRKVVDEGWLPRHQQIGITGRAVAPDLYLALGVAGMFNHTVGILRSGLVVSVNTAVQAPIFGASDIGVVADWHGFVEALREVLA